MTCPGLSSKEASNKSILRPTAAGNVENLLSCMVGDLRIWMLCSAHVPENQPWGDVSTGRFLIVQEGD